MLELTVSLLLLEEVCGQLQEQLGKLLEEEFPLMWMGEKADRAIEKANAITDWRNTPPYHHQQHQQQQQQ